MQNVTLKELNIIDRECNLRKENNAECNPDRV